ncbi:glucose-6-phosphate isomerase [Spiroplasma endosymbiont of Aspidapion aeneum]|uniref:glucose-6-phosphate isomerase n=1 Tax=Spiroplasma endosymbiont of Aspidapion aeneum TaxID=3066276 RepID=UPI00313C42DD
MIKTKLNFTNIEKEVELFDKTRLEKIKEMILKKTGQGNDFLGWVNWPSSFNNEEYKAMKISAENLRAEINYLLVIGIGGSYLGTRAADDMIKGLYSKDKVKLIYVGNTMSSTYISQLVEFLGDKEFGIVNISKSGTTTEPGMSFRVFEKLLVDKKGEDVAKKRIIAVTDAHKGALKKLADSKGYQTFTIPDDIGGRFSVFTPVGVYPLLVSGINIDNVFKGAKKAEKELLKNINNDAVKYAVSRYILHTDKNYKAEALVSYELQMQYFAEWWKQLFGESEGKDGKGLFPTSMIFSTDLHSLGQFIQEGTKGIIFETIIDVKTPQKDINVPSNKEDLDGLNYLTNKSFHEINSIALKGVIDAHVNSGSVPNIILEFDKMDDEMFGYAVYFFEIVVTYSGYLLDVNPFNQPGVEIYKNNMFKLLKKPGY